MKIMTILGTRPEIIRLSVLIPLLDQHCEHLLVHTGQNHDDRLSRIFFDELQIRPPDEHWGLRASGFGEQLGQILSRSEALFRQWRPDRLLILGDTNSGLTAMAARRLGLPVYHMEAGNRCFDGRVPEELNRRVIDHASTLLMPYTQRARENLLREGFDPTCIVVTGNPIKQVLDQHAAAIAASPVLARLGLAAGKYFLATCHRAENVDHEARLRGLVAAYGQLHADYGYPVICSCHPRTRDKLQTFGINTGQAGLHFLEPLGFFDFVHLEQRAFCVLSDSGTVQEECCLFGVPSVTTRDSTERPETVDCGANLLAGTDPARIRQAVGLVTRLSPRWTPPAEYLAPQVAEIVARVLLAHRPPDAGEQAWRA